MLCNARSRHFSFILLFSTMLFRSIAVDTCSTSPYTVQGSQQVKVTMRRRPQVHGRSSTRRAGPFVDASPVAPSNSFALFCDRDFSLRGKAECNVRPGRVQGPGEGQLLHRSLQSAIDQVTARFKESQSEYQLVIANSLDRYKCKAQMIVCANVVALLEDVRARSVLAE